MNNKWVLMSRKLASPAPTEWKPCKNGKTFDSKAEALRFFDKVEDWAWSACHVPFRGASRVHVTVIKTGVSYAYSYKAVKLEDLAAGDKFREV